MDEAQKNKTVGSIKPKEISSRRFYNPHNLQKTQLFATLHQYFLWKRQVEVLRMYLTIFGRSELHSNYTVRG